MAFVLEEIRKKIAEARNIETLRELRDQIHENIRAYPLLALPEDWNEWVNVLHDDIIRYAVRSAEEELVRQGMGAPPKRYAFLLFGSGGRREQTLWSDQDNGLIYEDPTPEEKEAVDGYFLAFSQTLVELLFRLGYPPCEGNVMCHNPQWGQSASGWHNQMRGWLEDPNWENVRYLLITADSRCVSGDVPLAASLREILFEYTAKDKLLLGAMLRNTLRRKASLGVLGNLLPERFGEDMGGIDIKYGAYIPLVNAIRLLAIRHGIGKSGTLDRISALTDSNYADPALTAEWRKAFDSVIQMRSLTSFKLEEGYYHSSGILPGGLLTKERKKELKAALKTVQKLHKYVDKAVHAAEME